MAADGCRQNRRQQPAVGNADRSFPGSPGKPENSGAPIYGSRIRRQDVRQQVGAGSACREFPENRRIRELQFMAPEFVARMRGSKWVQAQPAGKSRETGEFGNSNLWFPNSSIGCAAASGCRLNLPGTPGKPQNSGTPIYGSRIRRQNRRQQVCAGSACREFPENRRIRELQFMAPEFVARMRGSKWVQAQPAGKSRETGEFGSSNLWLPNSSPGCAAATGRRHCRPAVSGTGHCPVRK